MSSPLFSLDQSERAALRDAAVREPTVDENGVDLTLIRHTLSLTPTQRLKVLEDFMNTMTTVRRVRDPESK